jgi:hypothetical protein
MTAAWNTPDRDREEWAAVRHIDGYRDDDYRPTWAEAQRDQDECDTPTRWAAVSHEPAAQRQNSPTDSEETA